MAADGGWRVNQITYPELIDLLENSTDADAVILFGGTWCPNTRAVLPFINKDAQKNNVTVYNFDTVLDGGKVGGNPTGGANPLQTRNGHGNADAEGNRTFPSFLYGELVEQYLSNFQTEYQPSATNAITYFPGGDTTKTGGRRTRASRCRTCSVTRARAGTEPKAASPVSGSTRTRNGTNTEYMSNWWIHQPPAEPGRHPGSRRPLRAGRRSTPRWRASLEDRRPPRCSRTGRSTRTPRSSSSTPTRRPWHATPTGRDRHLRRRRLDISPPALAAALAALGANAPTNFDDREAKHLAERAEPLANQTRPRPT